MLFQLIIFSCHRSNLCIGYYHSEVTTLPVPVRPSLVFLLASLHLAHKLLNAIYLVEDTIIR